MTFKFFITFSALLFSMTQLTGCSSSSTKKADLEEQPSHAAVVTASTVQNTSAVTNAPLTKAAAGNALIEAIKSNNDEAIFHAATASLMQNANDVKALNALGVYQSHKGRPLAARMFFSKALQQQPNSSELYTNIGLTYLASKEDLEAIRAFHKAIELSPNDINASANLGSIYLEHRDFNKAYSVLSLNAGKIHDLKFLNNFAMACAFQGKAVQAESLYQEAFKLAPNNRELLFNYAIFQINYQNKFKEGLETLDHLKLIGLVESMKNVTKDLEIRAKAGLK